MGIDRPAVPWRQVRLLTCALCAGFCLCLATGSEANNEALINGDFETGDLSGWTMFTSTNGTVGQAGIPMVVSMDVGGDGRTSMAAAFKAGQRVYQGPQSQPEGGGIYQAVKLDAGRVTVTVSIAVSYSSSRHDRNLWGGLFEVWLNDELLDRHDFGPVNAGATERATLSGSTQVSAGTHRVTLQVMRPAVAKVGTPSPVQFVDHVRLSVTPS